MSMDKIMAEKYPEHAKLEKVAVQKEAITEFIEFLERKRWHIAEYKTEDSHYLREVSNGPATILAEFFDIDTKKFEDEKTQMIKEFQELTKHQL